MGSLINIAVKRDILLCSSSLPLVVANWCFEDRMIKIPISKFEIQPLNESFQVLPVIQDSIPDARNRDVSLVFPLFYFLNKKHKYQSNPGKEASRTGGKAAWRRHSRGLRTESARCSSCCRAGLLPGTSAPQGLIDVEFCVIRQTKTMSCAVGGISYRTWTCFKGSVRVGAREQCRCANSRIFSVLKFFLFTPEYCPHVICSCWLFCMYSPVFLFKTYFQNMLSIITNFLYFHGSLFKLFSHYFSTVLQKK